MAELIAFLDTKNMTLADKLKDIYDTWVTPIQFQGPTLNDVIKYRSNFCNFTLISD
jgi:hypothetical protein